MKLASFKIALEALSVKYSIIENVKMIKNWCSDCQYERGFERKKPQKAVNIRQEMNVV